MRFDRLHRLLQLGDAGIDSGLRLLERRLVCVLEFGDVPIERPFRGNEVRDRFQFGVRLDGFGLGFQRRQLRVQGVDLRLHFVVHGFSRRGGCYFGLRAHDSLL